MGFKLPEFSLTKWIQILFIGILVIWLLTQVLNLPALSSGDYNNILNPDLNSNNLMLGFFSFIIVFAAASIVLFFVGRLYENPRLDKTFFVTLVIYGAILYVVYAYVAQPIICNAFSAGTTCALPPLKFVAAKLFSISPVAIKGAAMSIFGVAP